MLPSRDLFRGEQRSRVPQVMEPGRGAAKQVEE